MRLLYFDNFDTWYIFTHWTRLGYFVPKQFFPSDIGNKKKIELWNMIRFGVECRFYRGPKKLVKLLVMLMGVKLEHII